VGVRRRPRADGLERYGAHGSRVAGYLSRARVTRRAAASGRPRESHNGPDHPVSASLRETGRAEEWLRKLEKLAPTGTRTYQLRATTMQNRHADPLEVALQFELASHQSSFMQIDHWNALLAAAEFETALEHVDFGDAAISANLVALPSTIRGLTHLLAGDRDAAEADLLAGLESIDIALSENPQHFGYLKARCQTLGALRQPDQAAEACAEALKQVPNDAYDYNFHRTQIASGLALAGRHEAALDLIEAGFDDRAGPSRGYLSQYALFKGLHDLPRWQALIAAHDS